MVPARKIFISSNIQMTPNPHLCRTALQSHGKTRPLGILWMKEMSQVLVEELGINAGRSKVQEAQVHGHPQMTLSWMLWCSQLIFAFQLWFPLILKPGSFYAGADISRFFSTIKRNCDSLMKWNWGLRRGGNEGYPVCGIKQNGYN